MRTTRTNRYGFWITTTWTACTACSRKWMPANAWSAGITPVRNCTKMTLLSTSWSGGTVRTRCWSSSMRNQRIWDCQRKRTLPSKKCTKTVHRHRKHSSMCLVKSVPKRPKRLASNICCATSKTQRSEVYHRKLRINCLAWRGSMRNCVTSKTIWSR